MGITDKITGRVKKAAGDLTGDKDLHAQGVAEERKGELHEEAQEAELRAEREKQQADEKRREAARLEARS
jgi:uncharacterized protein YjbJ (UPF0337 family)